MSADRPPGWSRIGRPGTAPGEFRHPQGVALNPRGRAAVAIDARGNVYVADTINHAVHKLSPNGEPVAVWGGERGELGQVREQAGLAVDRNSTLHVADRGNHRVVNLARPG